MYEQAISYLTIVATFALVLFPVLVPATVHAVHAVRRWQPTFPTVRIAGYLRPVAPRRLAVPAAA
jgi:hypothetical protein